MRLLKFGKYGLSENPVGLQVSWECSGRVYLVDVLDVYRREVPSAIMLKTRHFNGELAPDVAASNVRVIG